MPCQQLAEVSSTPFSTPSPLGTSESSLPLSSDILVTPAGKLPQTVLMVASRTVGPLMLSVIGSHFLGGANSSAQTAQT